MSLNLSPGEQVIFEGHPSWRAILGFYLKGILIAAIVGVVASLASDDNGLVFLIVLVIIAATVLVGFIKRVATTYTITNRRLNIKRGDRLAGDPGDTPGAGPERQLQPIRLPAGDADRRRRLRHRGLRRNYYFIFAGVAEPGDVVHKVDQATGASAPGSHGLGEAQPPQR